MAGKHSKKQFPIFIILAIVIFVIVIGIVIAVNIFSKSSKTENNSTVKPTEASDSTYVSDNSSVSDSFSDVTNATEITSTPQATAPKTDKIEEEEETTATEFYDEQAVTTEPYTGDTFSAELTPYKSIDTFTEKECTLKEVFGSSYSEGNFKFSENGTFSETLSLSSVDSGTYTISGDTINITYSNDKNMFANVLTWDDNGIPLEFIINIGGYDVYFK